MADPLVLPEVEADAVRYRVAQRDAAQAALDRTVEAVLERMGAAPSAQIHVLRDGRLAVVQPEPPAVEETPPGE